MYLCGPNTTFLKKIWKLSNKLFTLVCDLYFRVKIFSTFYQVERLAGAERSSLQATVRGMLKLMITKDVALLFWNDGMNPLQL
jgi:hypothetical protein